MSASLQLLQTTQQGKHDFRQNFPQNLVVLEVFCHFGYFLAIFDCHSRPKWGHQARKAWCQPVSSYCRQLNEVNIWFPTLFFHKIWYFWSFFCHFGFFWHFLTIFDHRSYPKWDHQACKAWCQPASSYCRQFNKVTIWFPKSFFTKSGIFGGFLPFWLFFGIFWQYLIAIAVQNKVARHVKLDVSQPPVIADNSTR